MKEKKYPINGVCVIIVNVIMFNVKHNKLFEKIIHLYLNVELFSKHIIKNYNMSLAL